MAWLLHDLGKYIPGFQAALRGSKTSVDHSTAGAAEILRRAAGLDKLIGQLIAYAIAGHHTGLPDRIGETGSLDARLAGFDPRNLDTVWQREITPVMLGLAPERFAEPGKTASRNYAVAA